MRKLTYTSEHINKLVQDGYSFREIAREFGKSVSTIHERWKLWRKRTGSTPNERHATIKGKVEKVEKH